MKSIRYEINKSSYDDIKKHLIACDNYFVPKLSKKVKIDEYSRKLINNAIRIEAWSSSTLIGLIAFYINVGNSFLFITNVSVLTDFKGFGIAKNLMQELINQSQHSKLKEIKLEVNKSNSNAINLYKFFNFEIENENQDNYLMKKNIQNEYKRL